MFERIMPHALGAFEPQQLNPRLLDRLAERVESGLFPMASDARNAYEIVEHTDRKLRFRSTNVLTGINVGLNDVTLTVDEPCKRVDFEIWYWTWARYAAGLCLVLFSMVAPLLLVPRDAFPEALMQGIDRSRPVLNWSIACFFGLCWPWILVAMHKGNAGGCLCQILEELNSR